MKPEKFNAKSEITEAVERLKAAFGEQPKGALLGWANVETVMGRGRYDRGGMTIVKRFRKWLRVERRIVTRPSWNTGIRLLTDKEAVREVPADRQRRAYRQVNRGIREMRALDGNNLSDHERKLALAQKDNLTRQRREIGRSRRALDDAFKPSETHPIRRRPEVVAS